jgi:hypothetical protein
VPDQEADLVHVGGDEDRWATRAVFRGDQVAEAIGSDLVDEGPDFALDDCAHLMFEPGDAVDGGEASEKVNVQEWSSGLRLSGPTGEWGRSGDIVVHVSHPSSS